MGDVHELEQRWRVTQRLDDEVAWLRARLLVGQINDPCVELGAFAGSLAARALVEQDLWRWPKLPPPDEIEQSLGPTDSRRWKLVRSSSKDSGEQLMARAILLRLADWGNEAVARALSAVAHASLDRAEDPDPDARQAALRGDRKLLEHGPAVELPTLDAQVMAVAASLAWHGEEMVRRALAGEVAPWALGYGDPVQERVDADR